MGNGGHLWQPWHKYGPVYHSTYNHIPKTAAPQPGGVMRSAKLNHVESACGESPKTSPLTPYCPAHTQTKSLTHQPPPVPTFRHLWSGKKHSNYWLDIGDVSNSDKYYVACSCVGVVQHWRTSSSWLEGHLNTHITHTSEDWKKEGTGGGIIYEYIGCRHTCLFVCCMECQRHKWRHLSTGKLPTAMIIYQEKRAKTSSGFSLSN